MNEPGFSFAMYGSEIDILRQDLYHAVSRLKEDAGSASLTIPLDDRSVRFSDSTPLTIALVGQYNAGKSTIIKALTGRSDIEVDSDICTEKTDIYQWNGIHLIDTPGIHAGREDHDSVTYEAIDRADLLMFVVTNELFDNGIGCHFRRLAFERQKGRELMLIVNKMSQDPGDPAVKRRDIERVIEPFKLEEVYASFTDAESFLEAQTEVDAADRLELIELSGLNKLIENMNRFVLDRGLLARVTTPVFELRRIADQLGNYFSVDATEERMALELLYRKRELLLKSRGRVEVKVSSELARAAVAVNALGDRLAESIKAGVTEAALDQQAESIKGHIEATYREAAERIECAVEDEVAQLRNRIEAVGSSPLSQQLRKLLHRRIAEASVEDVASPDARESGLDQALAEMADRLDSLKRVGTALDQIGSMAMKWATGPSAGGGTMSATAVAGSEAHHFVYGVGKFFGVKFAPWGAVHTAQIIGKIGVALGVAGSIFAVFAQISEDVRNDEIAQKLREARDLVRRTIREYVSSVENQFWVRYQSLDAELYEVELASVAASEKSIVGQRASRSETARRFQVLSNRASDLIRRVHDGVPAAIGASRHG